jgi:hypothetical protein
MKVQKETLVKAQTERNRVKKHYVLLLIFFSALLGNGVQVVAQEPWKPDFSNPVMTTDCCPVLKQKIDSAIYNAPIVFEGRMIKSVCGIANDYYLFEIEKVYRGGERLQAGTVEVIVKYPESVGSMYDHPAGFAPRDYILFAKEIEGGGTFDANNSIKLELVNDKAFTASCFSPAEVDGSICYHIGDYVFFRTKQEVLDFMGSYGLSSARNMPKADTLKTLSRREIEEAKKEIEEARKEAEEWEKIRPHYRTPEQMDSLIEKYGRKAVDTTSINKNQNAAGVKLD